MKSDFIHIFHDFIHVYSPGAGADNPWGRNLNVNRNILSLQSFVSKKSLKSDFIPFFQILYMYTAAGQGQTTTGDKILMSTETSCHFAHLLQVSKKISLKSDFMHFFHDFIHVFSPGAGPDNPLGTKF